MLKQFLAAKSVLPRNSALSEHNNHYVNVSENQTVRPILQLV